MYKHHKTIYNLNNTHFMSANTPEAIGVIESKCITELKRTQTKPPWADDSLCL